VATPNYGYEKRQKELAKKKKKEEKLKTRAERGPLADDEQDQSSNAENDENVDADKTP
jgi:hypothetical protein